MSARAWLCGAAFAGAGALALAWLAPAADLPAPAPDIAPPALTATAAPKKQPPGSSGVVETIRELPAEGDSGARRFEMTIRMRDGSVRISNETGTARWHAGDKVRLIGPPASR